MMIPMIPPRFGTNSAEVTSIAAVSRFRGLPLFHGLDGAALARLSVGAGEIDARSGSVIFRRGEPSSWLYLVAHGQVKLVLQSPQGGEKVVELVEPAGCFGSSSIFTGGPHALTAVAVNDSRLVTVARAAVLAELERTPAFARNITASLSHRLKYLIGALENCMVRSGTERVIDYLVNRVPGNAASGEGLVLFPAQKGIIASQLNLTQAHFSRILRDLAREGLIKVEGRAVRIYDVASLRANGAQA